VRARLRGGEAVAAAAVEERRVGRGLEIRGVDDRVVGLDLQVVDEPAGAREAGSSTRGTTQPSSFLPMMSMFWE
jgi:hypothetical protein